LHSRQGIGYWTRFCSRLKKDDRPRAVKTQELAVRP
jgi:hypothetical protein